MIQVNKKIFKKYTKKELKTISDGKIFGKLDKMTRRVWFKETNKLGEEEIVYCISTHELETILKEAKSRFRSLGKKNLGVVVSNVNPELTLLVVDSSKEIK